MFDRLLDEMCCGHQYIAVDLGAEGFFLFRRAFLSPFAVGLLPRIRPILLSVPYTAPGFPGYSALSLLSTLATAEPAGMDNSARTCAERYAVETTMSNRTAL